MEHFMLKEIIFRASMSYTERDFDEIVQDWIAGKSTSLSSFGPSFGVG